MNTGFTVSFFGHRRIDKQMEIEARMDAVIRKIISPHDEVTFLVGRDGDFDSMAAAKIREIKHLTGRCDLYLTWVMAYPKADYRKNMAAFEQYYDEIEICAESSVAHPKAAIQLRNRIMVDRSDLVVFYVEHISGGAHQTFRYAQRINKTFINLA